MDLLELLERRAQAIDQVKFAFVFWIKARAQLDGAQRALDFAVKTGVLAIAAAGEGNVRYEYLGLLCKFLDSLVGDLIVRCDERHCAACEQQREKGAKRPPESKFNRVGMKRWKMRHHTYFRRVLVKSQSFQRSRFSGRSR